MTQPQTLRRIVELCGPILYPTGRVMYSKLRPDVVGPTDAMLKHDADNILSHARRVLRERGVDVRWNNGRGTRQWEFTGIIETFATEAEAILKALEATKPTQESRRYLVFKDGNAWCAVLEGFTNLQECESGFASNPTDAIIALEKAYRGPLGNTAALEATQPKVEKKERYTLAVDGADKLFIKDNGVGITMTDVAALLNSPGQYTQADLDAAKHQGNEECIVMLQECVANLAAICRRASPPCEEV